MIQIELVCRSESRIDEVLVTGHAEFENGDGGDIVCAAISALVGFLGLTISEQFGAASSVQADSGLFRFARPPLSESLDKSLDIVLGGWVASVRQLEENYSGWVKVVEIS